MNKCSKCGKEFEGNFCPNCGYPCNPSNGDVEQYSSAPSYEFGIVFYKKLSSALKWLPAALFLLFAILNFVFMGTSAYGVFGFDMGNVYGLVGDGYSVVATLLVVISAFSAVTALVYPVLLTKKPKLTYVVSFVMYLLTLVAAIALQVRIKNDDYTVAGATKLIISFSIIFGMLTAIVLVVDSWLLKNNDKYYEAKTDGSGNASNTFFNVVAYKTKQWYASNSRVIKGVTVSVAVIAVICVIVFAVILPIATNIFSVNKVSQIRLGDNKTKVEQVLGKPYGDSKKYKWEYYGGDLKDLAKQQKILDGKVDGLTDLEELGQLMEQQAKLDEKFAKTTGKYIAVVFDSDDKVTSLTYDAKYNKQNPSTHKEVKSVTVGSKNTVDVVDIANNNVSVKATYADGSYRLSALPTSVQTSDFGYKSLNFPSSLTLAWSDDWGEYNKKVNVDESNYNFKWHYSSHDGILNLDGTIPTSALMQFFDQDLPWKEKEVKSIVFGANVTVIPSLNVLVSDVALINKIVVAEDNPKFYAVYNVVFDKNNNVILKPSDTQIVKDNSGNTFVKHDDGNAILLVSSSQTDELVLPYYNNGNYTVAPEVSNKYKKISFDQGELWTSITNNLIYNNTSIESITLPKNISEIGSYAFSDCAKLANVYYEGTLVDWCNINFGSGSANPLSHGANLYIGDELVTELVLPDTVTSIGDYAFYGCSSLTNVAISKNVTNINSSIFYGCNNLEQITVDSDNTVYTGNENCLIETASKTLIRAGKNAVIPDDGSVTAIGIHAFCDMRTTITVPECISVLYRRAFNFPLLKEINFNAVSCSYDNDDYGFSYYSPFYNAGANSDGIKVVIGKNVKVIPSYLFQSNDYGESFTLNLLSIKFEEGSSIETISYDAWGNCDNLQYNEYDNALYLGSDTNPYLALIKAKSTDITSCNINANTKIICSSAFNYCSGLATITIPDSVTSIGSSAFYCCRNLTNVTIPNSVISIGSRAFEDCSSFTVITIPNSVVNIGKDAFSGNNALTIYCETASKQSHWDESWNGSCPVVWDCNNNNVASNGNIYAVIDGIRYVLKDNIVMLVGQPSNINVVNIPSSVSYDGVKYTVTSISSSAFNGCGNLTSITIPGSVTNIYSKAFVGCNNLVNINYSGTIETWCEIKGLGNLMEYGADNKAFSLNGKTVTEIVIPDTVTAIPSYAFCKTNITRVTIAENIRVGISYRAFWNCSSLTIITIGNGVTYIDISAFEGCRNLTNVTIPDSITHIGSLAFSGCDNLTTITIGNGVTDIDRQVFDGCSKLKLINFKGTVRQWYAIEKDDLWDTSSNVKKIVCSNGEVAL